MSEELKTEIEKEQTNDSLLNDEAEAGDKLPSAKTISKVFKFLATGGIIVCAVLKWVGIMPNSSASEICMIWAVIYGLGAGTIDLNIMFDKFCSNVSGSTNGRRCR